MYRSRKWKERDCRKSEIRWQKVRRSQLSCWKKCKKEMGDSLYGTDNMDWLNDNISREGLDLEMERLRHLDMEDDDDMAVNLAHGENNEAGGFKIFILEDTEDAGTSLDEDTRKATFQT
jgi:hypothetical protein